MLQAIDATTLLQHKALFSARITRAAATPDDLARRQLGALTAIDASLVNFGEATNESLDLRATWEHVSPTWGRWRTSVAATHTLVARVALRPGDAPLDLLGDTGAPPLLRGHAMMLWSRQKWGGALFVRQLGAFASNRAGNISAPQSIPSWTVASVRVSRTFERGLVRGFGAGATLALAVGNVFDRASPFADTVFGYNGGLHDPLGRTYSLSVVFPLGRSRRLRLLSCCGKRLPPRIRRRKVRS